MCHYFTKCFIFFGGTIIEWKSIEKENKQTKVYNINFKSWAKSLEST